MIGMQVSKQLPYLDLSEDNYLVEYGKALLDRFRAMQFWSQRTIFNGQ